MVHSPSANAPREEVREREVARLLEIKPKLLLQLVVSGIPREIAEELFQDAFVIFWESHEPPKRPRRWFTGVLHHLALDWIRRRKRRARLFTRQPSDRPDLVTRAPRIDIEGLLAALDPANRNLLTALYIEGKDAADLAKQLKTTPSTIRQRASRARLALRKKSAATLSRNGAPDRLIE